MVTPRLLAGLEPTRISNNVLRICPGTVADGSGSVTYSATSSFDVDLNTIGANGIDAGSVSHGCDYFVYLIASEATGELSAVVSASITYSGVVVPAGYIMVRKLPWGFVYRTDWGGIPSFHLSSWPSPSTIFTNFQLYGCYIALQTGSSASWADISLSSLIPDNARLANVYLKVEANGTAGSAYIRSGGGQSVGIFVGSANPTYPGVIPINSFDLRTDSSRNIQFKTTGGATLTLAVMGYSQTEPS